MYVESESLIADPYANKMDKKRIEWKERDVFKVHCILFQKGTGKTYVSGKHSLTAWINK